MRANKNYTYLLLPLTLLLFSCSPVKHSFKVKTNTNQVLLNRLSDPERKVHINLTGNTTVQVYRTVFREYLVEKDNIIDYSVINDSSKKERVTYKEFIGYWQEIYLFRIPTQGEETFVYFSARFRIEPNEETRKADTVCLGFGPSYMGDLDTLQNEYVIHFEKVLKPVKTSGHFELMPKGKTDLKFIIKKEHCGDSFFIVSRIVSGERNKIGGDKNLVYETEKIFNDPVALKFFYLKQIKLKQP